MTRVIIVLCCLATAPLRAQMNLIQNGNFEQGRRGFRSDYSFDENLADSPHGTYRVVQTGQPLRPDDAARPATIADHTTGQGAMMYVHSGNRQGQIAWLQPVKVEPGKTYELSLWYATWTAGAGASNSTLQIAIGDENGLSTIATTSTENMGVWKRFSLIWESRDRTGVMIILRQSASVESGLDFVIDDISLVRIPTTPRFIRGDCNDDGTVDIADPVSSLAFQFVGTFDPPCRDTLDFDDDGLTSSRQRLSL